MAEVDALILLVDADAARAAELCELLGGAGLGVRVADSGKAARVELEASVIDVLVVDSGVSDLGLPELRELHRRVPDVQIVVLDASPNTARTVELMQAGACDVLGKPVAREELLLAVRKALARSRRTAQHAESAVEARPLLVGESPALKKAIELVRRAAAGDATVLIRGESGTGKELVARAVHEMSARASGPFVPVHCGALPENLLESELFGYEKGAFTGAVARKPGRVELAQGGTLFLDEIGDISAAVQVKLLRLLQERQFEPLGGTRTVSADVRFIAATHRDLESMIKRSEYRQDLFYRLNVVPLWIPPLRARREDIRPLVSHFVIELARAYGRPDLEIEPEALLLFERERWPGNVRELQNFVERLVVLSASSVVRAIDVRQALAEQADVEQNSTLGSKAADLAVSSVGPLDEKMRQVERRILSRALERAEGNRTLAARLLGVSRRTLYNKLDEHDLR
jgi:two-component system, NtrC family, response regulator AtoC